MQEDAHAYICMHTYIPLRIHIYTYTYTYTYIHTTRLMVYSVCCLRNFGGLFWGMFEAIFGRYLGGVLEVVLKVLEGNTITI